MSNTLSKDGILKNVGCANVWNVDIWYKEHVLIAMDEYAKQEAIGFAEYCAENFYLDGNRFYHHDYQDKVYFTSQELYELYLKSK